MPNISTHINFIRILINKHFNDFDINFLTLGSIAPNYYVIFNDINKECLSHFKNNINDKCDLNKFNLNIFNKNLNYLEKSFATGYYIHLWLDNYFDENMKKVCFHQLNHNFPAKRKRVNNFFFDFFAQILFQSFLIKFKLLSIPPYQFFFRFHSVRFIIN